MATQKKKNPVKASAKSAVKKVVAKKATPKKKVVAKKAAPKKAAVKKKVVAKKPVAKKAAPKKKVVARKAAPKKAAVAKKVVAKKAAPKKKVVAKKVVAKKVAPKKKVVAKKAVVKKAAPKKKVVAKKVVAKKAPTKKLVVKKAAVKKAAPKKSVVVKKVAVKKVAAKKAPAKAAPKTPKPSKKASPTAIPKKEKVQVITKSSELSVAKRKQIEKKLGQPLVAPIAKKIDKMSIKKEAGSIGAKLPKNAVQKSRYSDAELAEFDQLIDEKLIVAREQLEFYLKQLEDMAENPDNKIKSLDDGMSSLESERISSMAARQQKLLQHLENAKIRIKNKVYGICRETGRLISKERLRAVPHATLSIEAKQAQK